MKGIKKEKLNEFLKALSGEYQVFVPAKTSDTVTKFTPYGEDVEMYWQENTLMSPKDIFFPQTEKMYKFKTKGMSVDIDAITPPDTPKILFGIRSCDVQSIDCMDKVFLTRGYEDDFYKARRENTLLFALACTTHADSCFCTSMGVDPQQASLADVQMSDVGDALALEAKTPAGEEALKKVDSYLTELANPKITPLDEILINVDMEGVPEKLESMFEHPIWDEVSPKCIGCSTCTYVCPTCYCFDIDNKLRGEEGTKIRCWDCCMFSEYSRMAGGHNPRPSKKERVRNRFMDKLLYNKKRHGQVFCVGCGRCVAKCPVNLEIATIIQKVKEAAI